MWPWALVVGGGEASAGEAASRLDGIDATTFRPALHGAFLGVEDGTATDPGALGRVVWTGQLAPVVLDRDRGADRALLTATSVADALVGWSGGHARVGVQVPVVTLASTPDGLVGGLGDVRLDGLVALGHGLAIAGRVSLPTAGAPGFGLSGPGGDLLLVAGTRVGRLRLAANVGPRLGPEAEPGAWRGLEAHGAAGLQVTRAVAGAVELDARAPFVAAPAPVVARVGGGVAIAPGTSLRAMVGAGLAGGLGAPDGQLVVALVHAPVGPDDAP